MPDECIVRVLNDDPKFYASEVRMSFSRLRPRYYLHSLSLCRSRSDGHDAASFHRFASDQSEEFIEKNEADRDSVVKKLFHNSQGSGSMHSHCTTLCQATD